MIPIRWSVPALVAMLWLLAVPRLHAQPRSDYQIGPGDVIQVQVWGASNLGGRFTVDPGGRIIVPHLGEVMVDGLTPAGVGDRLKEQYSILFPSVTEVLVSVEGYFSRRFTVLGEVRTPGQYTFMDIPSVWELLARAGGPTPAADLRRVEVARKTPASDEPARITVNLSPGAEQTPADSLPALRPGDTVFFHPRDEAARAEENVQLMGAVQTPGFYSVQAAERLSSALGAAGGPLQSADLRHVRVLRRSGDGTLTFDIDIETWLRQGRPDVDMPLKAGDIVSVPHQRQSVPLQVLPFATALAGLVVSLFAVFK